MKKIVHFGKYYPPDMGGIESVTQTLAEGALNAGHDVQVICFGKTASAVEVCAGVKVVRHPITRLLSSQPLNFNYFFNLITAGRRADIIHLHAPNLLASLATLFIGKKSKLVVHWHSDIVGKGALGRVVRPLEKWMLTRANIVLATSQAYMDGSAALNTFSNKVAVVPLGIAPPAIATVPSPLSKRLKKFVAGRKIVLSVGRLTAYKGFSVLIEAAKHFPDDVAIIVAGGGELLPELTAQLDKNQLQNKVLLAGRVTDEELIALYMHAEVFCLPSIERSEAFGVVLLEAMAYGLPVVATNIPGSGVPWVNAHQVSGENVTTGKPEELAESCIAILNNPTLREQYSLGARKRFKDNFLADKFCKKIMDIYIQLE
ncbi:MAG: glycosyltransferase [Undibacterium sp.]|uniref:glycosyltransferase n=1 Tax=Undibacterium sp. TaxID=1914977 RepID=UPI0027199C6A|nr:glycosyltransferase [Undibacterium sp.]MDO8651872.1 glycosyltransferase [Undibacterium sp.]